jgi:hypothetical protein
MSDYFLHCDQVKILALSLPDGCTDGKCVCPSCGEAGSFNISRDGDTLKFICFRVSCGFKGIIGSNGGAAKLRDKDTLTRQVRLFTGELDFLNEYELIYLADKFSIDTHWLEHVRWGIRDSRVYYPQYSPTGRVLGYIARHYPDLGKANGAKAYWKPVVAGDTGLCLPSMEVLAMIRKQRRVVLVEDYPSCLRIISQLGIPCCCMGGTNLYESMIDTLIDLGVDVPIVVLDADAVVKAGKMKRALQLAFPNAKMLPLLGADPKDMSADELAHVFDSII